VSDLADLAVGAALHAARLSGRLVQAGARIAGPVLDLALWPPLVPRRLQPGRGVQVVIERWQHDHPEDVRILRHLSGTVLPAAVDAAVGQVDVTRLVTAVLDRLDLERVVSGALERLDLTAIVVDQVDLSGVVSAALQDVDLTAVVVDQVDLGVVVAAALRNVDLTAVVVDQVDLGVVVAAALRNVDLTQIVMQQVDLIGVAEYVVDGIDLPGIIRDSTGSVASEAVRGLRMQGVDADAVVGRAVDRVLHRRRQRRADQASEQPVSPDAPADLQGVKPV
jgi:hypothetical protein